MSTPDYTAWDMCDDFSIIEAAFLWVELEPDRCSWPALFSPRFNIPKKVSAIASVIRRELSLEILPDANRYRPTRQITRTELRQLAERKRQRPLFLYREDRPILSNAEPTAPDSGAELEPTKPNKRGSSRADDTLYRIIGALAQALAEANDSERRPLLKDGRAFPGGGVKRSGVVGYLMENGLTSLGLTTLETHIGEALKIYSRPSPRPEPLPLSKRR